MSKKIDWNALYREPKKPAPGHFASGKELMAAAYQKHLEQERIQKSLQNYLPAMNALFTIRMAQKTPIVIMRDFQYQTSEIVHDREWNYKSQEFDGEIRSSRFQDVTKVLRPGTTLMVKSIDTIMKEFIFEDQTGQEIIIPMSAQQALMRQSNIYESTVDYYNTHQPGE
jgi:hypothetical protein